MPRRMVPLRALTAALVWTMLSLPTPVHAGNELIERDDGLFLGMMLREFCVETFPRFAKAPSIVDSKAYFVRRDGEKAWDHKKLAATMSFPRIEGKPACVMTAIARKWRGDTWAAFAVPVFGAIWESDETIVGIGTSHPGDNWEQHIVVRFPTHERFVFDADRRSDGLWRYTISIIASK